MAPAVRRSNSLKVKDHRRSHFGFRIAVYGGFILFTCCLLLVIELVRYGYLTSGGTATLLWVRSAEQEANFVQPEHHHHHATASPKKKDLSNGDAEDMLVGGGDPTTAQVGELHEVERDVSAQARAGRKPSQEHTSREKPSPDEESKAEIVPSSASPSGDSAEKTDKLDAVEDFLSVARLEDGRPGVAVGEGVGYEGSLAATVSKEENLSPEPRTFGAEADGGNRTAPLSGTHQSRSASMDRGDVDVANMDETEETGGSADDVDEQLSETDMVSDGGDLRTAELQPGNASSLEQGLEARDRGTSKVAENQTAGDDRDITGVLPEEQAPEAVKEDIQDETVAEVMEVQRNGTGSGDAASMSETDWNIPRAIPRKWVPPKPCATAEEMGAATVGDTRAASLRVRSLIQRFIVEHGAERVGGLSGKEFCRRGFVLGMAQEDGFGNSMYKVLTAAGLAVMLNRSLIIGERGATNPAYVGGEKPSLAAFGEYLDFSNQTFTMREVKRLWALHGCATTHKRPLVMHTDALEKGIGHSRCLCDDWGAVASPILHFTGATGTAALQLLLKNAHPAMRSAAARLLGNPSLPSSRPNTFGELFRAFITPNADIRSAVAWALKGGPDPDVALHLRMLHSRTRPAPAAAAACIRRITQRISPLRLGRERRPRVVVVTDTPAILQGLERLLGQAVEVVRFDYLAFAKAAKNQSEVMSLQHGVPPRKRVRDWGEMPRWVAMVDFFLAARARAAVVSGAYRRVSTTYAQLVAALAAADSLEEAGAAGAGCAYYSSFQPSLVAAGLASQSGWGHTWRPFGGKLGCRQQAAQCARTPLLPYAWWDAPWQSPIAADVRKVQGFAGLDAAGQVSERQMDKFCAAATRRPVALVTLHVPSGNQTSRA